MKTILALAVLAVIAAVTDSSAISNSASASSNDLNVGSINSGDLILFTRIVRNGGNPNTIHTEDVVYRGGTRTIISAVRAFEIGATEFASPRIISGGIGQRDVTVRFTSTRGRGYSYELRIWGRL